MVGEKGYWQPPRTGSARLISRRRALRNGMISSSGLVAATFLACESSERPLPPTEPVAKAEPKRGGTLVHPRREDFDAHFDAHLLNGAYTGMMGLFYQNLLRYDPRTYEILPDLAKSWESPAPTEFVFHLTPGVRWQDKPPVGGRELTAEDIVFALDRMRTDDPKFINRALMNTVERIEAVDNATVRVTLREPDVTLLTNLADLTSRIISRETVEKFGTGKLTTPESAIGTGPFILRDMDDVSALAVRNPYYWKPSLPYLDGVNIVRFTDDASRWAAFLAGKIDVNGPVPGREVKGIRADQGRTYFAEEFRDIAVQTVWVNTRRKPFDDTRVPRALRLLVDHNEFISSWAESWFGGGSLQGGAHLPKALDGWDFSEDDYARMLEFKAPKDDAAREARSLLGAAGFDRDNPLRFELSTASSPEWAKAATQLLQSQFLRLSQNALQPEIRFVDNATHITLQSRGEFDVAGPIARASFVDPDQMFRQTYHSRGGQNFGRYSDAKVDQMIEKQRTIFDTRERRVAVTEIVRYLLDNAPYTGTSSRGVLSVAQAKVRDWAPESTARYPGHQYEYVWLDT